MAPPAASGRIDIDMILAGSTEEVYEKKEKITRDKFITESAAPRGRLAQLHGASQDPADFSQSQLAQIGALNDPNIPAFLNAVQAAKQAMAAYNQADQRYKAETECALLVGLAIRLDQVIEHRRVLRGW